MPNGLSGGFVIEKDRLRAILERVPRSTCVSSSLESTPMPDQVADRQRVNHTARDLLAILDPFPRDEIVIQQHDDIDYVIRWDMLPPRKSDLGLMKRQAGGLELWHTIDVDSPIYQEIVAEYRLWLTRMTDLE
jgi:hypothetical protein